MKLFKDQLLARQTRPGKRATIVGGLAAISMAVIVGTVAVVSSFAANEQLYLSPATGSVLEGNTIAVQIRVNSGTDTVNAVQANLSYDPTKLQYQSVDPSGTAFSLSASAITTSGVVKLARATGGGEPAVSGDKLFATVTFKALAGSGTAEIKIDSDSHVVRSTDAQDILSASAGATYTLTSPVTATPTPEPTATVAPTATPTPTATPVVSGSPQPTATPAAYNGKLMLSPATASAASGENVSFSLMEDSGSTEVNAIQANLKYSADELQYVGVDATGSDFPLNAVTATGSGSVKLTRALNGGDPAVTGSKLVAKVTFKVLKTAGTTNITFDTGSVISTLDGKNALVDTAGATVTVTGGNSTPTPTPTATPVVGSGKTPTPTPTAAPQSTPTPAVIGKGNEPINNPPVITDPVVTIPVVGARGSIKVNGITKLTAPAIPSGTQIAYAIDGQPTTPVIDTTTLDNGSHTVTATTIDPATGVKQEVKQKINVQNTQPLWKTLVGGMKSSWPYLALVLVVIGLGIGLSRFMRNVSKTPEVAPSYVNNAGQNSNMIHPTNKNDKSGPLGF